MVASPNSLVPSESVPSGPISSDTAPSVLTLASASVASSASWVPQHGGAWLPTSHDSASSVTQRDRLITGASVPPSKSYTTSMSPATRLTRSLFAHFPLVALLNSNATCAEGDVVFCGIRIQASDR